MAALNSNLTMVNGDKDCGAYYSFAYPGSTPPSSHVTVCA